MIRSWAIDIDGVLADLELPIKQAIEQHFGVPMDEQKRDAYYMHDRFNIDPRAMSEFMDELFYTSGFWYSATPMLENIQATIDGSRRSLVYLVTGRQNPARQETLDWFKDKTGWHGFEALLMHCLQVKHRALKYVGAEFMIEDRYEEAKIIAQKGFRSYLYETHYNSQYKATDTSGVIWVPSVRKALELEHLL